MRLFAHSLHLAHSFASFPSTSLVSLRYDDRCAAMTKKTEETLGSGSVYRASHIRVLLFEIVFNFLYLSDDARTAHLFAHLFARASKLEKDDVIK